MKKLLLLLLIPLFFACEEEESIITEHKLTYTAEPLFPRSDETYDISLIDTDGEIYTEENLSGFYMFAGGTFTGVQHIYIESSNVSIVLKVFIDDELIKSGAFKDNKVIINFIYE